MALPSILAPSPIKPMAVESWRSRESLEALERVLPLQNTDNSRTFSRKTKKPLMGGLFYARHSVELEWLRGLDLNQRPLGYEDNQIICFQQLSGTDGIVERLKTTLRCAVSVLNLSLIASP